MNVLLIEPDVYRRRELARALRAVKARIVAVGRIAEIERWPVGDVVVTDITRFTPWWRTVGAACVVVLVPSAAEGRQVCADGASAWALQTCSGDDLIATVRGCFGSTEHP